VKVGGSRGEAGERRVEPGEAGVEPGWSRVKVGGGGGNFAGCMRDPVKDRQRPDFTRWGGVWPLFVFK
jgi:hypothetical protein